VSSLTHLQHGGDGLAVWLLLRGQLHRAELQQSEADHIQRRVHVMHRVVVSGSQGQGGVVLLLRFAVADALQASGHR